MHDFLDLDAPNASRKNSLNLHLFYHGRANCGEFIFSIGRIVANLFFPSGELWRIYFFHRANLWRIYFFHRANCGEFIRHIIRPLRISDGRIVANLFFPSGKLWRINSPYHSPPTHMIRLYAHTF
jgi:hypothetical protein